ncbi:MAG TPA: UpxY family transcription antiterminator [Ignavibacteria bacterium]|nr:UpxY family transcription antiterminator [Ignavibacteria bacterium]
MDKEWFVMRTKPRNENKVYLQVQKKNIEVYYPVIPQLRIWSDRKKKIFLPMFPGYLFIHGDEQERYNAIADTSGATGYLMYLKKPAIVKQKEIDSIKISLQEPERIKVDKLTVQKGDLVEVTGGAFAGLRGFVIEFRGSYKIVVNIIELNASINIELLQSEMKLIKSIEQTY